MESIEDFFERINDKYYINLSNGSYIVYKCEMQFICMLEKEDEDVEMNEEDKYRLLNLFYNDCPLFLQNGEKTYIYLHDNKYVEINTSRCDLCKYHIKSFNEKNEYFALHMNRDINLPSK